MPLYLYLTLPYLPTYLPMPTKGGEGEEKRRREAKRKKVKLGSKMAKHLWWNCSRQGGKREKGMGKMGRKEKESKGEVLFRGYFRVEIDKKKKNLHQTSVFARACVSV